MATAASDPAAIAVPFPIFQLAHRYLLYDVDTVSYARREHNISGVLAGGLPQASQQNVFLGLPLELMPEEVRLLVEAGAAYIVDDVPAHKRAFLAGAGERLGADERRAYQAALRKQGLSAARDASKRSDDRKKAALKQKMGTENWNDIPEDMLIPSKKRAARAEKKAQDDAAAADAEESDQTLFPSQNGGVPAPSEKAAASVMSEATDLEPWAVTPTTSYPPLQPPRNGGSAVPATPRSYPLFKHLHSRGYFLSPGLRFGCQYMAYPGDPLRFHSHFLCRGMDWDEEFDLSDIVGGGRLGTGVKKGYLVGGQAEPPDRQGPVTLNGTAQAADGSSGDGVRAFCIEWAGM